MHHTVMSVGMKKVPFKMTVNKMTVIDIFERIFGWDICVKMNSSHAVFEWQPDYTLQRQ